MPRRAAWHYAAASKFGLWKPRYFLVLFLTGLVLFVLAVPFWGAALAYMVAAPKVRAAAAINVISFFIWRFSFGLRPFKVVCGNHSGRHMKDLLNCN